MVQRKTTNASPSHSTVAVPGTSCSGGSRNQAFLSVVRQLPTRTSSRSMASLRMSSPPGAGPKASGPGAPPHAPELEADHEHERHEEHDRADREQLGREVLELAAVDVERERDRMSGGEVRDDEVVERQG